MAVAQGLVNGPRFLVSAILSLPSFRELDVRELIAAAALRPHFQPIVDLRRGQVYAHEALIRGPAASAIERPDALFAAARGQNLETLLELACVETILSRWSRVRNGGRLFVNLSARALVDAVEQASFESPVSAIRRFALDPASIVVELTEHEQVRDFDVLFRATDTLRAAGVGIALDDFGDGRSSLRLWSELKPDIVKIDKYFAQAISTHADKLQTLRALLQIAEVFGTTMVAEGIERAADLMVVRDLGIALGQGFVLGTPAEAPVTQPTGVAMAVLASRQVAVFPELRRAAGRSFNAARLLIEAPTVTPRTTHDEIIDCFHADPGVHAIAIVDAEHRPLGLLNRQHVLDEYTKPYFREVYGRRSCMRLANTSPLLVDVASGVESLTSILTSDDQRYLTDGFVIVEDGRYRGLGTGEQLVRAVTELRIEAARHANPLTFLPGNIPITDHIARLIASGGEFVACHGDLDRFKPFNDHYGYWRGDEVIRLAAQEFVGHCDPLRDFVGHVGGDDFVVLFQSADWRERCHAIVAAFNQKARAFYDPAALGAGGIHASDRDGTPRFFSFTTLSIGAVRVAAGQFRSPEDVASAAAAAKRLAKSSGDSLRLIDAALPPLV